MEPQQQEMNIIIASPSLNLLGGAQRACLHAINALRKTNCKIVLATIDKTDWALVEAILGDAVYVNAIPVRLMHFPRGIQTRPGIQWKVYSRLFSTFLRFLGDAAGVIVANSEVY